MKQHAHRDVGKGVLIIITGLLQRNVAGH